MTRLALQVIVPRQLFDVAQVIRILENSVEGVAKDIKIDFDVTAQAWSDAPKATIKKASGGTTFAVSSRIGSREIIMIDERYGWVNDGVPGRAELTPRKPGGVLVFPANYKAKTTVRSISSQSGGSFGPVIFRKVVRNWPGIKARHFDEEIAKKWNRLLPGVIQRAILSEL